MSMFWIIVADSSRARFFAALHPSEAMNELADMVHVEGRLHDRDNVSDRPGGIAGGHGEGGHTFEAPTDLKHHEMAVFARQIAERLETSRVNHDFDKLVLVAPPAFLGTLRDALNDRLRDLVYDSIDKHLVTADESEIRAHVFESR